MQTMIKSALVFALMGSTTNAFAQFNDQYNRMVQQQQRNALEQERSDLLRRQIQQQHQQHEQYMEIERQRAFQNQMDQLRRGWRN